MNTPYLSMAELEGWLVLHSASAVGTCSRHLHTAKPPVWMHLCVTLRDFPMRCPGLSRKTDLLYGPWYSGLQWVCLARHKGDFELEQYYGSGNRKWKRPINAPLPLLTLLLRTLMQADLKSAHSVNTSSSFLLRPASCIAGFSRWRLWSIIEMMICHCIFLFPFMPCSHHRPHRWM